MRSLRIAVRSLLRRPVFAGAAAVTLALGLGATAAMFAVLQTVVLDPLPYPEPDELVRVDHPVPLLNPDWVWGVSEAGWWMLREESETLEDIGVYSSSELGLAGDEAAEPVTAGMVTANVLELIGAAPVVGRGLRWEDNEPGAAPVVVLGHGLWRTRFNADPRVVGSSVRIEGQAVEVVGVLGPGARLPEAEPAVWLPLTVSRDRRPVNSHWMSAIGRLAEGVDRSAAETELATLVGRFPEALPDAYYDGFVERTGFSVRVLPLRDHVVGDIAGTLWVLLAAVGLVLLIACANVANLFLVRLEGARRERAVRTALGAGRMELVRPALVESLVLTGVAAAVGLVLAWWAVDLLLRMAPDLPRIEQVAIGWESVAVTAAAAVVAGLLFGLLAALRSGASMAALREGVGMTSPARGRTLRAGLVVAEIALALVVVAGAALMVRTFQNLRAVDPGFESEGVLTVQLSLPGALYRDEAAVADFHRELATRAAAIPGVEAVGATSALPLASGTGCALVFTEDPAAAERAADCFAAPARVTPGYFRAMRIRVEGREPTWEDVAARRGGVVASAPLRDRLWPGAGPEGQGIRGNGPGAPYYRTIGVAEPVRGAGLDEAPVPRVYFPMLALEGAPLWSPPREMTLVLKTATGRPGALAGPVRALIRDMDPTVAVGQVRTMREVVAASTARTTFTMLLLTTAAVVALLLGVIGLYGLVSYLVEQRRPELGIRMALGARAATVRGMVVRQAALLAGTGVILGLFGALGATRLLAAQLFEVEPADPVTLTLAVGVLLLVALLAALIPADRAARIQPMRVLRGE